MTSQLHECLRNKVVIRRTINQIMKECKNIEGKEISVKWSSDSNVFEYVMTGKKAKITNRVHKVNKTAMGIILKNIQNHITITQGQFSFHG